MSIAPKMNPTQMKFCFMWCGEHNCECQQQTSETIAAYPQYIYIGAMENIIMNGDLNDHMILRYLLDVVKYEPNDVLRGLARARLEGNAVAIITNLTKYSYE